MEQYSTFIFIALLVLAFYFLILRPQRKRQQALQQTMNAISPGSRVMLGSGLFGTVVWGRDKLCWRSRLVPRSRCSSRRSQRSSPTMTRTA